MQRRRDILRLDPTPGGNAERVARRVKAASGAGLTWEAERKWKWIRDRRKIV